MLAPTPMTTLQRLLLAGWLLLLLAAVGSNGGPTPSAKAPLPLRAGLHIVMLNQPPNTVELAGAKSKGRVAWAAGLTSTRSPAAVKAQVTSVATKVLGSTDPITHIYSTVLEGFAAVLNPKQVAELRKQGLGVFSDDIMRAQALPPSERVNALSVNTASSLGLDAPGGLWSQVGGSKTAGEDMIIAAIDSGYTPDLPDFSDTIDAPYGPPPPKWQGGCQPGQNFDPTTCNRKAIGCRYFTDGFGGDDAIKNQWPQESISCRPGNYPVSHGDAVLSNAGGNQVPFSLGGAGSTSMSGAAPRARLAMYKALWGPTNDGAISDIIAAIDQAVSDGVDAIILPGRAPASYSNSFNSPYMMALKNAAAAGVILSGPAGNTGSDSLASSSEDDEDEVMAAGAPTVDGIAGNIAPWMITVGATTNSRDSIGIVRTVEKEYQGRLSAQIYSSLPVGVPLVLGNSVCLSGVPLDDCRLCNANTLDPAKAAGKVVVCDLGGPKRSAKSAEVKRAGGTAMILLNTPDTPDNLYSEYDSVNTIQLIAADRDSLRAYAATAGATATFDIYFARVEGPKLWAGSSRGPIQPQVPDLIKPDFAAPGANIIVSQPNSYRVMSGTSLAAATTAGVAVLLKQKTPTLSPMAIKSALTTSASQTMTTATGQPTNTPIGGPFEVGGGGINPNGAADPGLVFDSGAGDFQRFQCSQTSIDQWALIGCAACVGNPRLCDPLALNIPSIAALNLAGTTTFKRTVTSSRSTNALFRVQAKAPTGFTMTVVPDSFTLSPGSSQILDITITKQGDGVPNGQFSTDGFVVISGAPIEGGTAFPPVRMPVVARSRLLRSPRTLAVTQRTTGFYVEPSFAGKIDTLPMGFDIGRIVTGVVSQDPTKVFNFANPASTPGVAIFNLNTSPSRKATWIRIAMFNEDFSQAGVTGPLDLDMYVYNSRTNKLVASSAFYFSNNEEVVVTDATYLTVYVHGYMLPEGTSDVPVRLYHWTLRSPAPGSQNSVSKPSADLPVVASPGRPVQVSLTVNSRLLSKNSIPYKIRYWGMMLYGRGAGVGAELPLDDLTFLTIDNL